MSRKAWKPDRFPFCGCKFVERKHDDGSVSLKRVEPCDEHAGSNCGDGTGCSGQNSGQIDNGVSRIARVEVRSNREVFGENARDPDRSAVVVWTENGARFVASVPHGAKYVNGELEVYNPPLYERSVSYEENGRLKSRFGAFVAKYGSPPRVGLLVATLTDERGYLTVDTEQQVILVEDKSEQNKAA